MINDHLMDAIPNSVSLGWLADSGVLVEAFLTDGDMVHGFVTSVLRDSFVLECGECADPIYNEVRYDDVEAIHIINA